jgi:hypothetical protein
VEPDLSSRQAGFWQEWQQASSDNSNAPTARNSATASKANSHGTGSSSSSRETATQAGKTTLKLNQPLQQQQQQQPGQLSTMSVGPGSSSAQTWSGWVQAKGWRGEAEVHRQQLLEWFGASPDKPLKGSAGKGTTPSKPTRLCL